MYTDGVYHCKTVHGNMNNYREVTEAEVDRD